MKSSERLKELKAKDVAGLTKELEELQRAHFSLRMQAGTQQLTNSNQLGNTRRDIARVKTLLNEKRS
jgi:large subunit ribosomal protein L29